MADSKASERSNYKTGKRRTSRVGNDSLEISHQKGVSNASLTSAVDLFVMTKFDKCFQVCRDVIKIAKCEPEQERNHEVIEAAAALGIQALAEMDQWQDTVSFITEVYGAIHLCSPRIVQVCILLHAHVEEYLPCHKLVQQWLQHPDNSSNKNCAQVIQVYGYHILLPAGQFGVLEEIVKRCKTLSEEERAALLKMPQAGRYKEAKKLTFQASDFVSQTVLNSERDATESRNINVNYDASPSKSTDIEFLKGIPPKNVSKHKDPVGILETCKHLYLSFLANTKSHWRKAFIAVVMSFFAIWALVQAQTGESVSSLERVVILWRGLLSKIKSFID